MAKEEIKDVKGDIVEKAPQGQQQPPQQQVKIKMDDEGVASSYSNLCRVTGTPEELIVDFSLNPNPFATGDVEVKVDHRLALNYYTAKRLFVALQQTLARHEQNFGVIELNVRRRMTGAAAAAQDKKTT